MIDTDSTDSATRQPHALTILLLAAFLSGCTSPRLTEPRHTDRVFAIHPPLPDIDGSGALSCDVDTPVTPAPGTRAVSEVHCRAASMLDLSQRAAILSINGCCTDPEEGVAMIPKSGAALRAASRTTRELPPVIAVAWTIGSSPAQYERDVSVHVDVARWLAVAALGPILRAGIRVDLVGVSLGAAVAMKTVELLPADTPRLGTVFLLAPDIGESVVEDLERNETRAVRYVVFGSTTDFVLTASEALNGERRAGQIEWLCDDVTEARARGRLANAYFVDVSAAPCAAAGRGHSYHTSSPDVVAAYYAMFAMEGDGPPPGLKPHPTCRVFHTVGAVH